MGQVAVRQKRSCVVLIARRLTASIALTVCFATGFLTCLHVGQTPRANDAFCLALPITSGSSTAEQYWWDRART
jgi:hypothetical protein